MDSQWCTRTVKSDAAMQVNVLLTDTATWTHLKFVGRKGGQSQKITYCVTSPNMRYLHIFYIGYIPE